MRIAHVITRMIVGGAQENTLLCCLELIERYEDDVLLITGPALGPEGDLLQQSRAVGLPVHMIPQLRRSIHPWRDWVSYRAIKKKLREFQPDVVHTHSAKGGILGRRAAHALNVPAIIHTVHGAPFHPYQNSIARNLFRWCEQRAARQCHRLVSVADAMTDLLVESGVADRNHFQTIYSGMDVEPFLNADDTRGEVRERLGFKAEHIVIGKIARLFHLKGHEYVVEAMAEVIKQVPEVRVLFVGDGIRTDEIQSMIADRGLSDHFCFTGLVPPAEIPSLIGAMDVLVHASLREGLARALPQALIAGKPVVSFDIDGAREVVKNDQTGFLVEPKDVAGLANALLKLVQDGELRQRLGEQGRGENRVRFQHQEMTRQLRELYEALMTVR